MTLSNLYLVLLVAIVGWAGVKVGPGWQLLQPQQHQSPGPGKGVDICSGVIILSTP